MSKIIDPRAQILGLPKICALLSTVYGVDPTGFEPVSFSVQGGRSTN